VTYPQRTKTHLRKNLPEQEKVKLIRKRRTLETQKKTQKKTEKNRERN